MLFNGTEHEAYFNKYIEQFGIRSGDNERVALIYTLTITADCRKHTTDLYNAEEGCVKGDAIHHGWVTGSDARAIRLAFNLFNGFVPTALTESEDKSDNLYDYQDNFEYDGAEVRKSLPCEIFADGSVAEYFLEAVRIRFGI